MSDLDSTKPCKTCEEILSLDDFHRNCRSGDGRQSNCKRCVSAYGKQYRERNKQSISEYLKQYRDRNRESISEYLKQYGIDNKDRLEEMSRRWYLKNAESVKARVAANRIANPEKVREWSRNRKARVRAAEGKHTAKDVALKLKEQQGLCYWCGMKLSGGYHVDHIIPLAKGGSNWAANICCSCPPCNMHKHDKMPWEFSDRLF